MKRIVKDFLAVLKFVLNIVKIYIMIYCDILLRNMYDLYWT